MERRVGRTTAKAIPRKRGIEMALQELKPHPKPMVLLEQYTIPAPVAAEILFIAGFAHDDIREKTVLDLGTGTGRLAIGCSLIGAARAIGVDIDSTALKVARENAAAAGAQIELIHADINAIHGRLDTVVMNPPFGTKIKHMDRAFLSKALEIAKVTYSLHKSSTRRYVVRFVKSLGGSIKGVYQADLEIPRLFDFHRKKTHVVPVDLYRIEMPKRGIA